MTEEGEIRVEKKPTLLQKYKMPVEHLSYEYVDKCNDDKELEKILKILRSGEEGIYPQLIASAEARLQKLKPDSRALCTEQPVLRKETTNPEQFDQVLSEIEKWREEMCAKEKEIKKSVSEPVDVMELPAVRSRAKISPSAKPSSTSTESKGVKSISPPKRSPVPRDYSVWEKYDADKELTLMEIEEQKQQEEKEKKKREEQLKLKRMQEKSKQVEKVIKKPAIPVNLTPTEREILATREKDKGNEFFKVADYENAVKYYSASLEILPTPVAYNNRAIAMLKLHQYDAALRDCNEVLKVESENVKALMRRGIAYQNKNYYQKAYDDFTRVGKLQPENRLAMSLAKQMKSKFVAKRRGVRMKIDEEGSPMHISGASKRRAVKTSEEDKEKEPWKPPPLPDKVMEAPWGGRMNPPLREGYNTSWPYGPPAKGPYTEYGLPKNFCNCNGEPEFVRHPQIICLMCHERRVLGLPPLPGGDCNCPHEPAPQPVASDTGECANNTEAKKETSTLLLSAKENKTKELKEAPCDTDAKSNVDEERPTPPPPPVSHAETEVRQPQLVRDPCSEWTSNTPESERTSGRQYIETVSTPEGLTRSSLTGQPKVPMNVAPKYVCATKREKPSQTPALQPEKTTTSSAKQNKTVVEMKAEDTQNADGLQKIEALNRLSVDQVPSITSAYEFTRAWGGMKPDPNLEGYAKVLKAVAPENLRTVVGNKLDGQMLSLMLRTLERNFVGETETLSQILHNIALLPRFSIAWAFLDSSDKAAVKKMVSILENSNHKISPAARQAFQL